MHPFRSLVLFQKNNNNKNDVFVAATRVRVHGAIGNAKTMKETIMMSAARNNFVVMVPFFDPQLVVRVVWVACRLVAETKYVLGLHAGRPENCTRIVCST